jgi:glucoamylase
MVNNIHIRAGISPNNLLDEQRPLSAYQKSDLPALAPYMLMLLMRNVTSDGFVISDPRNANLISMPGCVIAAPSFPANTPGVDQDYVFNWVRDAAIAAVEIAEGNLPCNPDGSVQALIDYVSFAQTCQNNAQPTGGHACFTISGNPRPWTEQSDGPALQIIALLHAYPQLDQPAQALAQEVIATNLSYLLSAYQNPTTNLWEEHQAMSFFARSVQLKCFQAVAANQLGIAVPQQIAPAINWLQAALADHWNGSCYVTMMQPGGAPGQSALPPNLGYDVNIDVVCASVYGAVPCTDTKLLASAAQLRSYWADPNSANLYPINLADTARGLGPMFGRYPGDTYDGDVSEPVRGGHPWALCTANFAELYYNLANQIDSANSVPFDPLSSAFFAQIGVTAARNPADASATLRQAGDAILRAILYHSDHYELSEQFDGTSGYEKSVHNLTWSYAAFLSALRARAAGGGM